MLDVNKIPLDDSNVWQMISEGNTKGCFQIESHLCQIWCKRLKPQSILELSDLIALVRPGCLKARTEGKNMVEHYQDRKSGKDEVKYLHPSLEPILKDTQGIIVYQEQQLLIATNLCGFSENKADELRKAIGKKNAAELFALEADFINGAKTKGIITEEIAKALYENIRAAARYSFNKCLSPETLCEVESGEFKTLSELQIGDKVKTPNGYSKVINKYNNGVKKLYRVTMESGKSIECTLDHKFLCESGEILPLEEILEKEYKIICDKD